MLKEWIKSLTLYIRKSGEVRSRDINGKKHSLSSRVVSGMLIILLSFVISIYIPNGFSDDFIDYIKDIFAIFVGFFVTVLTFVFDKLDTEHLPNRKEMDNMPAEQRWSSKKILRFKQEHNYSIRFFYTIGLIIIYAVFVLILLIPNIFWKEFFDINLCSYSLISSIGELNLENVLAGLHCCFCFAYRFIIVLLTLRVFYFTLYSTSSLLQVLISKKKIDTWN